MIVVMTENEIIAVRGKPDIVGKLFMLSGEIVIRQNMDANMKQQFQFMDNVSKIPEAKE